MERSIKMNANEGPSKKWEVLLESQARELKVDILPHHLLTEPSVSEVGMA